MLRFEGVPVGLCELSVRRRAGGYHVRRRDTLSVLRDGARVDSTNTITIETNARLEAQAVTLTSHVGPLRRASHARRDGGGWLVTNNSGQKSRRPSLEIAELALVGAASADGPVLLAGADFAAVERRTDRETASPRVTIELTRASLGTTSLLVTPGAGGLPRRWSSDTGESAVRLDGIPPTIDPPELLDLAALPGKGRRSDELWVRDARRDPPPSLAGQRVELHGRHWRVEFHRRQRAIPTDLASLVTVVADALEGDLSLPGLTAAEALRMGRGDCSGHAAALAQLASQRGYETRLATGYRRRGRQWLRHRWVVARLGQDWVSLDPSFGEATPSPGRLLLLATHGADVVALADLVTFAGMGDASASFER